MATLLKVKDNGNLPPETAPASEPAPSAAVPATEPRPAPPADIVPPADPATTWQGLVQGSLVLADLLLVAMAIWLVVKTPGPLGGDGALVCVLAFILGAWLSCLALGWPRK